MPNIAEFFAIVRAALFGGTLSQPQVAGINAILTAAEPYGLEAGPLAYCLATAYHETAQTMQPIREYGGPAYFHRMYDPASPDPGRAAAAKQMGALPGDGVRYFGRGYVQLTWRRNYSALGKLLGVDLEGHPDLACDPAIAARVMFEGMTRGLFTGRKLAYYYGRAGQPDDDINARRIINGTDKAEQIAGQAKVFRRALIAGGWTA